MGNQIIMSGNNGLIDLNNLAYSADKESGCDFFLFSPTGQFEPTIEELFSGEVRADWEDETDDNEEMEIGGTWEPSTQPPIEHSSPQTLKIELLINISINGQSVPFQVGSNGADSLGELQKDVSHSQGEEERKTLLSADKFSQSVLRI